MVINLKDRKVNDIREILTKAVKAEIEYVDKDKF